MKNQMLLQAAAYLRSHRRKTIWYRVVTCLAAVVVFCTTYALILPAITMEKEPTCGLEAHVHDDGCYQLPESILDCEISVHAHTDACYGEDGGLICPDADYVIHTHGALCYDSANVLVCTLPEVKPHVHGEGCYTVEKTASEASHIHTDACYAKQKGDLICGESTEPHTHNEDCYKSVSNVVCGLEETEDHTHIDSCYETADMLVCEKSTETAHVHTDECYAWTSELICGLSEETKAPSETSAPVLTCTQPEICVHRHSDSCYADGTLICGLLNTDEHNHTSACLTPVDPEAEPTLICDLEEHIHDEVLCYIDETADLESEDDWKQTLPEKLDGDTYAQDLIAVAESQLGYTESTRNVQVDPDGRIWGYSRYGAWYGDPYGQWDAMFVSFCLHYAEIEEVKAESSIHRMVEQLKEDSLFLEEHLPQPGDLIFLTDNEDEYADRVGIIINITDEEIKTIEGDTENNCVEYQIYESDDQDILGYYTLPEKDLTEESIPDTTEVIYFCGQEEHIHSADCFDEEGSLICQIEEHTHTEECMTEPNYNCGREEHSHDEGCYDTEGNLICDKNEHAHILACMELSGEAVARVEAVIAAIDAMPSADEIDAQVAQFQEQGDEDGEIAYLEQVYAEVQTVYWQYSLLSADLQQYVFNADKLLELEYIWSATTLGTSSTHTIYQINSYNNNINSTMFIGGPPSKYTTAVFEWWWAVKVEQQDGCLRVTDIWPLEVGSDKSSYQANDTGFVLMFHDTETGNFPTDVAVGDYVTLTLSVPQNGADSYAYNSSGYGTVTFSKEVPSNIITSAATTVLQYQENGGRVAHTSDFIDLNIYNYNYSVNDNWRSDQYYPGFQWPGGAYIHYKSNGVDAYNGWTNNESKLNIGIPNWSTHRRKIDSVNFGDSVVANHQYADSYNAYRYNENGLYGKAVNATSVGKVYDTPAAQSVGKINWLWYSGSYNDDSVTNRPAGFSTTGKAIRHKLDNGVPITVDGISLKYLFPFDSAANTTANGVTKQNSQSIDGLFQVNPVSGLYYYNSQDNHAQYSNNKFTLYDEIITPNFIMYPFGNFLPFNSINNQATQVGALNKVENGEGRMKTYVNNTLNNLNLQMLTKYFDDYQYSSRYQLNIMLQEYAESWYNAGSWDNLISSQAITDFFAGSESEGPGVNPGFTQAELDNMYNIDWDEATDFFFGMDMSMNILMPKNGLTGKDNGNNNMPWTTTADGTFKRTGFPDGIPDYPMVFNFAGDDDVWVFVDGLLFLDLTGIHRHVGGTIDFETGMVYYFGLDPAIGDTTNNTTAANYYFAETFEEIIKRSFTSSELDQMNAMLAGLRPVLNADGTQRYFEGNTSRPMKTFKDYSTHTFKFFYMERGSGSSVCRMNFNFPMLRENSISVAKELTHNSTEDILMLGDPYFAFQIMKANADGSRTQDPFFGSGAAGAGKPYKVYDAYTNEFIRSAVTEDYGIFKIKAGERAEFTGISENSGKYYIREILDNRFYDQYENIYVDGALVSQTDNVWNQFKGPVSPVKDISDGTTIFTYNNRVDAKKLSFLTITKMMKNAPDGINFDMNVELNGEPIPVGTPYTLYQTDVFMSAGQKVKIEDNPDRVVTTEGIVTVPGGATAEIDNILPGTTFHVSETSGSAEGYTVSYGEFWGTDWIEVDADGGGVGGTVPVNNLNNPTQAHVCVTVTNTLAKTQVPFSVYKQMVNATLDPDNAYTVNFTAKCIYAKDGSNYANNSDFTGGEDVTELLGSEVHQSVFIQNTTEPKDVPFNLYFDTSQFSGYKYPVMLVYEITEDVSDAMEYTHDPVKYYATFYLYKSGNKLALYDGKVYLTTAFPGGTAITESQAIFRNYLLDEIRLTKLVDGGTEGQNNYGFEFYVRVADRYNSALVDWDLKVIKNGVTTEVTTDSEGKIELTLKHGESVRIQGIPVGGTWEVGELNTDGFEVSWQGTSGSDTSNVANGNFPSGGVDLVFTNKPNRVYELPETGGPGTIPYTMAGLMLMLLSAAYLLYKTKKCRREVG